MKRTILAGVLIAALTLVLVPRCDAAAGDEKVELKYRFEAGKTYTLLMTVEQQIVTWINEVEQEVNQTIGIGETFEVKSIADDGTATIVVTFGPMSLKSEGPMGKIEYDSENPPKDVPLPARAFATMLDQHFTMKMTPEGRVTEIRGMDVMFDKILESLELPEGPMKDSMIKSMKKQFGDQAIKEMLENFTGLMPDKPVGVGDAWSQKMALTTMFPSIIENTCTLTERKDGVATIAVDSTIKPNADAPPLTMGPMKMTYKLKGSQKGTFKLDEATGWFVSGKMTQKMSGEMVIEGTPGDAEKRSLPMSMESVITFKSK